MNKQHYEIVEEFNGNLGDICQEVIDLRDEAESLGEANADLENQIGELETKVRDLEKQI